MEHGAGREPRIIGEGSATNASVGHHLNPGGASRSQMLSSGTSTLPTVSSHRPRRRRRRKVTPRFYRMLALLIGLFVVASYAAAFWRIRQVENQIAMVRRTIEAAQMRNEQLREDLDRLASDDYVEDVAREELGLVKQGETAFIVVKPQDPESPYRVERRNPARDLAEGEGW